MKTRVAQNSRLSTHIHVFSRVLLAKLAADETGQYIIMLQMADEDVITMKILLSSCSTQQ